MRTKYAIIHTTKIQESYIQVDNNTQERPRGSTISQGWKIQKLLIVQNFGKKSIH